MGVWPWDAEDRDDSFVGDADLGDEGFDGGLALAGSAAGHDVGQVSLEPLDDAAGGGVGSAPMVPARSSARAVSWVISPRSVWRRCPAVSSVMVPFSNAVK
jgi:hypothetical protein